MDVTVMGSCLKGVLHASCPRLGFNAPWCLQLLVNSASLNHVLFEQAVATSKCGLTAVGLCPGL